MRTPHDDSRQIMGSLARGNNFALIPGIVLALFPFVGLWALQPNSLLDIVRMLGVSWSIFAFGYLLLTGYRYHAENQTICLQRFLLWIGTLLLNALLSISAFNLMILSPLCSFALIWPVLSCLMAIYAFIMDIRTRFGVTRDAIKDSPTD